MPCTCEGLGLCAYCDWSGFRNGHNKRGGGPRMVERDEDPDAEVFIEEAEPFDEETFTAMFFNWRPRTETADTVTEDESPQMGDISMAIKKTAAKKAKKPTGAAGSRAPGMKKTGAKKKPARAS